MACVSQVSSTSTFLEDSWTPAYSSTTICCNVLLWLKYVLKPSSHRNSVRKLGMILAFLGIVDFLILGQNLINNCCLKVSCNWEFKLNSWALGHTITLNSTGLSWTLDGFLSLHVSVTSLVIWKILAHPLKQMLLHTYTYIHTHAHTHKKCPYHHQSFQKKYC